MDTTYASDSCIGISGKTTNKRKATEEIIAELEAEGVDVKAFMRRIYATIERAKAQHTAN